jgi:uncharacterized membrane protein
MAMFGRSKKQAAMDHAATTKDFAVALARDKKFRKQVASALGHGAKAKRRARSRVGMTAAATRLATDRQLRSELQRMSSDLQNAWNRVESKKQSHKLRNTMLVLAGGAAATAGAVKFKDRLTRLDGTGNGTGTGASTIDESIEVEVPVSTAYNQWTQFEEFPLFMEGVDDVRQLDDTRLHWVATIGGRTAEWDAKILEQHPDRQISWISEDGKQNRGTVTFESLGENRTLVRLSLGYQAEGFVEAVGSAAGLDRRRIEADLMRFKELIEARGTETGAWREDISAGKTT